MDGRGRYKERNEKIWNDITTEKKSFSQVMKEHNITRQRTRQIITQVGKRKAWEATHGETKADIVEGE